MDKIMTIHTCIRTYAHTYIYVVSSRKPSCEFRFFLCEVGNVLHLIAELCF